LRVNASNSSACGHRAEAVGKSRKGEKSGKKKSEPERAPGYAEKSHDKNPLLKYFR
jgi:hypothetical protein